MKYLFVCKSNRGRSQMAEGFFNYYHHQKHNYALSAGTKTQEQGYEGWPVPSDIVGLMDEVSINLRDYRSKQLTPRMVISVEKVVVMCERELCPDYLLRSDKVEFWPIPDPCHKSADKVRECRDDIGKRVWRIFNGKD